MSKVITISRKYPSYHSRKDDLTFFVEKILNTIGIDAASDDYKKLLISLNKNITASELNSFVQSLISMIGIKHKYHTCRAGYRFKVGDWFSPRVWGDDINPKSGRRGPYHSKQIIIAPDIQVKKIYDFDIHAGKIFIDLKGATNWNGNYLEDVARNDGLTKEDFLAWFKFPKSFGGQIIAWSEKINY